MKSNPVELTDEELRGILLAAVSRISRRDAAARAARLAGRPTPNMWMRSPFASTGRGGIDSGAPPTAERGITT